MSIKISVVIPTFKRPALLVKCLFALRKQSLLPTEYEVIVVTDGPDFYTKNAVANFISQYSPKNLFCLSLPQKAGPAAARNSGAASAKGVLIAFTDDDCIPHPDWLNAWWTAYNEQQKPHIAFTGKTIVPHSEMPTDYEKNIAQLETAEFITANCACSREAFSKTGGFDEDFPVAWREDSELHFRFITAEIPVLKVETAIVVHPVREASWGVSLKEQKKSRYNALLLKKHPNLYKQKIGTNPLWNYYAIVLLIPAVIVSYVSRKPLPGALLAAGWLILTTSFIIRRLTGTSKTASHVLEMVATSLLIPFLSVFWTLYGSIRYKKFLL